MRRLPAIFFLGMLQVSAFAAHLVGGDMYYDCLGDDNYRITLKLYRDCESDGAPFDGPALIGIYDGTTHSRIAVEEVYLNTFPVRIPAETNDPCLQAPPNLCVEEGVYSFVRNLPPIEGGYDIVYIRCCRNGTIINIPNPGGFGATYTTHIPEIPCNSSPRFTNFPPIAICLNAPITFDHSATDPDGDQLIYSLCTPYAGADSTEPQPYPDFTLQPFSSVPWRNPYNASNPLNAAPLISINSQTGLLTGTPTRMGQFVVAVCIQEMRNGVLIGETKRDFQFNVTDCTVDAEARIPVIDTTGAAASGTRGVFKYHCTDLNVQMENQSRNSVYYRWDFGDPTTNADTSTAFEPTYSYPDSGIYKVTLIVNPRTSCSDTTAVLVVVYPTFDADFDFVAGCADQQVTFADRSTTTYGSLNGWTWRFGDGVTDSAQNTAHLYNFRGGNFSVTLTATTDKGCTDSETKTVTVHPLPEVDFTYTPVCINTPVTFTDLTTIASGNVADRTWLFNNSPLGNAPSFTEIFNNLISFDLSLIATSDHGCVDTVTENITVNPLPVPVVRADTALCIGESVRLFAAGGVTYQWQPATALSSSNVPNPVSTPASTTNYTVTVMDSNQCSAADSVLVTVHPLPNVHAGSDVFICAGNTYQLNGTGEVSYSWVPGNVLNDSTIQNPIAAITDTTTFTLTTFSAFGCRNSDAVTIAVQHPVTATFSDAQDLCEGDTMTLSASGGMYYLWAPADGLSATDLPNYTISPDVSTTYSVIVSNDCFADTGFVNVTIRLLPEADAGDNDSMVRDEFVFLNGSASGIDNAWMPVDGLDNPQSLSTRASPFNTTDYILTSVSEYGCIASDTVTVFVEVVNLVELPTAFSPNSDGRNDVFHILKTLNVQQLLAFKVYNRWGQQVFATTNLDEGWDGRFNGVTQEMGVYAYVIQILNRDGVSIVKGGNVTLVK